MSFDVLKQFNAVLGPVTTVLNEIFLMTLVEIYRFRDSKERSLRIIINI